MYPQCVSKDVQQEGNELAAPPGPGVAPQGSHFMPGFVRRRPLRAVLLAAAVIGVSYSLARHGQVGAQQPHQPASAPPARSLNAVSIDNGSGTFWNPPIGLDRTNEALDRLTIDFTSAPQTHDNPSGFQADPRLASLPNDAGRRGPAQVSLPNDTAQPAPAQQPDQVPPTQVSPPDDAAQAPPAQVPSTQVPSTQASLPADAAQPAPAQGPAKGPVQPHAPRTAQARPLEDIDQYLWRVYQRSTTKRDSSGDFTWKDEAAAARRGLVTKQYVIGGMDRDFRELLYDLGHAMDEAGLSWTILSGFRDDYRQGLASGYKAHVGNSFHGGSRATGGYGHGCAADIEASDGESSSNNAIWKWVDQHGEKFGIVRPMKQIDPAHIQPFGGWHDVAFNLRDKRGTTENRYLPASVTNADVEKITPLVDSPSGVSEAQFDCVRSHRSGFRLAGLSHHHAFPMGGRMHRASLFHPPRMHRFGRRRMVVDANSPDKHTGAEMVHVAGQADAKPADVEKHAKAEASDKIRRDAMRQKAADTGPSEKHSHPGKEASPSTEAKWNARGQDAKGQRVADRKHPLKRTAAENPEHQAKAKSRVVDREEASDKSNKKL
jgi:hypothetical protein